MCVFVEYDYMCWIHCEVCSFQDSSDLLASEEIHLDDLGGKQCFIPGQALPVLYTPKNLL